MGRKRKPDNIKILQGTAQKCRMNEDAPDASPGEPRPPEWLRQDAVRWFHVLRSRLEGLGLSSESYTEDLGMAASRIAEIDECTKFIQKHGTVFETTNQNGDLSLRANPAVRQRSEAMRHLQTLLSDFGLTPAAISKVSNPNKNKSGNKFSKLG